MLLIVNETHNCKMKLFRTAAAFCFDGTFHAECIKIRGDNLFHMQWWGMVKTQVDGSPQAMHYTSGHDNVLVGRAERGLIHYK